MNLRDLPPTFAPFLLPPGVTPAARATLAHVAAEEPPVQVPLRVGGKFLFAGDVKFYLRGVTYGTFGERAMADGSFSDYPADATLDADFAAMRANGVNTVRCYTVPPRRLLDAAARHGLRVLVGLPWEQHVAFLDEAGRADDIERRVRAGVRSLARHPAVLAYAVGNEIPASIVRWLGAARVERFLERLIAAVKDEHPGALVTYVNFPTTEYLRLPSVDFVSFNVYLESRATLEPYLDRLQNLAGEKPLVMAEIGLDSLRNGDAKQGESLDWQVRTAFAAGCAGIFVFAWTDEWHRGGHDIEDWDFGLVRRDRTPKPALATVAAAFREAPFAAAGPLPGVAWPPISVVVCSCNGARTIRDTLEGLRRLAYPQVEVIVIDDGSKDATAAIAAEYPFVRLTSTPNRGLSAARNLGWQQATGEIVAYIDDDAYPDPHWLHYLAYRFCTGDWVGVGGPNIAPHGDGSVADCVANAPGGPVQVLLSDTLAEHVPGCNMAFRRSALAAIDGFDPIYRAAGDDVDLCWRLQDRGWKIGFHAAAMDWHHRRNSLQMYWKQQQGYGKAEALLEAKWPNRYNPLGHVAWGGQLYGRGPTPALPTARSSIYGGVWGSAAYQSLYSPGSATWATLPLMPEWWLGVALLAVLALLGLSWTPLLAFAPLALLAAAAPLAQAALAAAQATFPVPAKTSGEAWQRRLLTFYMHLQQPVARLIGRRRHGLVPWRRRGDAAGAPAASPNRIWSETWHANETWVEQLEAALQARGFVVTRGGVSDAWDLDLRGGLMGTMRARFAIEEHGAGRQLVRLGGDTRAPLPATIAMWGTAVLALGAALGGGTVAATALAAMAAWLAVRMQSDQGHARAGWNAAVAAVMAKAGPQGGTPAPVSAAVETPAEPASSTP
jgi:GT2 family glycosyltransferase